MENIIQMLIPLLVLILTVVLGSSRRRKTQKNVQTEREGDTLPENDAAPPPFVEDFSFETRFEDIIRQQSEAAAASVPEEPEPVAVQEPAEPVEPQPPPVPVESPAGIRSVPATSLLELSPRTFRQGIVLREILGHPRSRRRGAPFRYMRNG